MKFTKIQKVKQHRDPLDLIEEIIINNGWDFDRDNNNNIHAEVGGDWCDYQLSFGYNDLNKIIYVSCALDIKISINKSDETYRLLANINERLSLGHFEVWLEDGWPIYRCSIPLTSDSKICKEQIEFLSINTLEQCEKFYPAFQFLAWGNKNAKESLDHLMLETKGEV